LIGRHFLGVFRFAKMAPAGGAPSRSDSGRAKWRYDKTKSLIQQFFLASICQNAHAFAARTVARRFACDGNREDVSDPDAPAAPS